MHNGSSLDAIFRNPQGLLVLEDGNVIVSDTQNQLLRFIADGEVSTFAGFEGVPLDDSGLPVGTLLDGKKNKAVFQGPSGMSQDIQGNIYVADTGNHAIRKISSDGQITTLAGDGVMGLKNGSGEEVRFNSPHDIAVTEEGTIYVADTLNHVIRQITADGQVSTLNATSNRLVEVTDGIVQGAGDYRDGSLTEALFNEPSGLALDDYNNLYVSDSGNHLIRYIDFERETVTTVAGRVPAGFDMDSNSPDIHSLYDKGGCQNGEALQSQFNFPKGIVLTSEGGLVIADSMNHAVRYLKNGQVYTLAGSLDGSRG